MNFFTHTLAFGLGLFVAIVGIGLQTADKNVTTVAKTYPERFVNETLSLSCSDINLPAIKSGVCD